MNGSNGAPVTFLLPNMEGGGAEKLTLSLMSGFLESGYAVDLVLTGGGGELLPLVPPEVHLEALEKKKFRSAVLPLREYIQRRKPRALISAMWPLPIVSYCATVALKDKPRLLFSEHVCLSAQYGKQGREWLVLKSSIGTIYRFADQLIGVSDGVCEDLAKLAHVPRDRVVTIYNPIPSPPVVSFPKKDLDLLWGNVGQPRIITVGKLKDQKNHDLLLRAFEKVHRRRGGLLAILGSGPLEQQTRGRIAQLGLSGAVLMPGFVLDPAPWYASSDVFVLSSDYEGFGNVIVEAMHHGLPIVSTDCPSGPREILEGGRYGWLVPVGDDEALATAIEQALDTAVERSKTRERANFFSVDRAVRRYRQLADPEGSAG